MKTLTLTDEEFEFIKMAVSVQNDMMQDCMFDNISLNLYPRTDETTTILFTPEKANRLRVELETVFHNVRMLDRLMIKLGIETNNEGFSR